MSGRSNGFTFLEIIVAMVIIGIMATLVVPTFFRRAQSPLDTFVVELQSLVQAGIFEAEKTGLLHRVFIDLKGNRILLEAAKNGQVTAQDGSSFFVPVAVSYTGTEIEIPEIVSFRQCMINGIDELAGGFVTKTVWFFIDGEGAVQDIRLGLVETETNQAVTLTTNPFSGQLMEEKS